MTVGPTEHSPERRAAPRSRALRAATLSYDHGRFTAPCLVRNKSHFGYLLLIDAGLFLPPRFDLMLMDEQDVRRADLRWRRGDAAGVSLVTSIASAFDMAQEIEALRAENAALHARDEALMRRLAALGYVAADEF